MSIAQFLRSLKARWLGAALIVLAALGLAAAFSLVMPRQYTASAAMLVDAKAHDPLNPAQMLATQASAYMAMQMDVIRSERVVRRVATALALADDPLFHFRRDWKKTTDGAGDFDAWMAERILKQLEVRPTRESGVIGIHYTATDRHRAAQIANAFVQAYIDTALELRVEPARRNSRFFDDRSEELRIAVEKAQLRLSTFQRDKGLLAIAPEERLDIESARLNELSTQLVALQALAGESVSRQSAANNNTDRAPEVLSSPIVASLSGELSRQEARLSEMTTRLGEQHPAIQELRANIAQLRGQIASESRRVTASLGVSTSVNQSRIAQARAALEMQRAKVVELRQLRDEAQVLQRDVQAAQRNHEAIATRLGQSELESRSSLSNIAVLKNATAPAQASSPRLGLNLTLALVLGSALAIGWTLLRELNDRRLRSADDVGISLGMPLLVELPHSRHSGVAAWWRRTAGSVPTPASIGHGAR